MQGSGSCKVERNARLMQMMWKGTGIDNLKYEAFSELKRFLSFSKVHEMALIN